MGASIVSAAAIHGVFAPGSYERLEESILSKIYVTNTIAQHAQGKIEVTDISQFILKIIKEYSHE